MAHIVQKIGFYSIRKAAKELCRLVVKFTPIIRNTFPDNATLLSALATANAACEALHEQIDEADDTGV